MAGESVSFRITRTTEDLAQTVAALSQRLVKLEQRLGVMQLQLDQLGAEQQADSEDLLRLDNVASLLADCRSLLEEPIAEADHGSLTAIDGADEHNDVPMAA